MKKLLRRFCTWAADKFSSRPVPDKVHSSLTELFTTILQNKDGQTTLLNTRSGLFLPFDAATGKFIIFSDQHKGAGDAADDFVGAQHNYTAALDWYYQQGFTFINLGDCEELWENKIEPVLQCYPTIMLQEVAFQTAGRYVKVFGNHDLLWFDKTAVTQFLAPLFTDKLQVYEGVILQTSIGGKPLQIFLTHGHQGDAISDSNAFSKWFIGRIWVPVQRWLDFKVNTPAKDFTLRDRHNQIMYNWTEGRQSTILITGHTHKPVFESLDHLQRLAKQLNTAQQQENTTAVASIEKEIQKKQAEYGKDAAAPTEIIRPAYYNTGCCCFNDGDITGIEIENGMLRLVRWHTDKVSKEIKRGVCEEAALSAIATSLE